MSNQRTTLSSIFQNGTAALQFSQLYRFATLFLTGIVLAKMGVPSDVIGVYEMLIFLSSAVSFFWLNGFMQNLLIQYPKEVNRNALVQNTFWWLMVCRVVVTILYFAFVFQLYPALGQEPYRHSFQLFGLVILVAGAAVMSEYMLLLWQKPGWLAGYSFLHYTANLVIVFWAFYYGNGLAHTVWGLVWLNLVRFGLLVGMVFSQKWVKPNGAKLLKIISGTAPLIIAAFFSGSVEYISGFIVSGWLGESAFALYRYGAKELPLTLLLANAFSAALIPQIAEARGKLKEMLIPVKKSTSTHIKLLYVFSGMLMAFSPILYPALFNPQFAASASIFNIFLLLVISRFVFPQSILLGLGYRRVIMQASVLELITALLSGFALGHFFGINGVAFSVVIASFVEKAFLAYRLYKLENITPAGYIPIKTWSAASAILLIIFIVIHFFTFC